ncbi:MAG: recognition motif protein [Verrucomicrobiales bacterium]|nr:recognition motif protein [Verrucomicrobiales bacterium]MDB6131694.1 recognition motif protein [Verrucomicrobiales bacterium]
MSTKLFVGNLSYNTTENDLQDAFGAHGTVMEVNLMMDKFTGRSRGFAFVTMESPDAAKAAIAAMNGADVGGRALTVNEARPREEGGPRGGGGGGSRGGGGGGGGFRGGGDRGGGGERRGGGGDRDRRGGGGGGGRY